MSILKTNQITDLGGNNIISSNGSGTFTQTFAANTPAFSAYLNSAQTISASTWTKVGFDAEHFDTNSAFDTSNNRFVVPSNLAGKYCFVGQIYMEYIDDNKTFRMNWDISMIPSSVSAIMIAIAKRV